MFICFYRIIKISLWDIILNKVFISVAILLLFSVAAIFLEDHLWYFSLIVQFKEWFLALSLIFLVSSCWIKKNKLIAISLGLSIVIIHTWSILPSYLGQEAHKTKVNPQEKIDIFYANLNSQNDKKHLLIQYLQEARPEYVMLVEFNSHWAEEVSKLESIYPYTKAIMREGNFGMAVLSKTELVVTDVYVDRENMILALVLKTNHSGVPINLVLLHAYPPIGKYGTILRDQYLITMFRAINDLNGPTLVCGDFNTTPWTSIYKELLHTSDFRGIAGYMIPNTWPTTLFFPGLPIDHCLSKKLSFVRYEKGPDIGSDHWPLEVQVSF